MRTQAITTRLLLIAVALLITSGPGWARPARTQAAKAEGARAVAHAPNSSVLAVGWDSVMKSKLLELLDTIRKGDKGPRRALASFEAESGLDLDRLLSWLQGSGYLSVSSDSVGKPVYLLGLALADEPAIKAWLFSDGSEHASHGSLHTSVGGGWLYLGNSPQVVQARVSATSKSSTLGSQVKFSTVLSSVPTNRGSIVAYLDGERAREMAFLKSSLDAYFPKGELSFWDYGVLSVDFEKQQSDGFLSFPKRDSGLTRALHQPGAFDSALLKELPHNTDFIGLNLGWVRQSLVGFQDDSSVAKWAVPGILAKLDIYGSFEKAFDGPAVVATDGLRTLSFDTVDTPFNPKLLTVGRVRDTQAADRLLSDMAHHYRPQPFKLCAYNLRNIGTAMELWSTDNSGHYPTSLETLVPEYLKEIPKCPVAGKDTYSSSLQTGPKAKGNDGSYLDYYLVHCQGHHHPELDSEHPMYDGIRGLTLGPEKEIPAPQDKDALTSSDGQREYSVASYTVKLDGARKIVKAVRGPSSRAWLKPTPKAELPAAVQDSLKWGGKELLAVGYVDYTSLQQSGVAFLTSHHEDEVQLLGTIVGFLQTPGRPLDDVHAIKTSSKGLHYRGQGVSSSSTVGLTTALATAILYPNYIRARHQGYLTTCKSNLKHIGTGLEMWATDNSGKYPESLDLLTPDYIRKLPTCPESKSDEPTYVYRQLKDAEGWYEVTCSGERHKALGIPADYPRYNGGVGLVARPE